MKNLNLKDVSQYVEDNIGTFHQARITKVKGIDLKKVLSAKNPYLFKAKNMLSAEKIVENILSATISSSEETMFGNWLEGLAVFIAQAVFNGQKSLADGIDLELTKDNKRYVVVIKSGKVWGNKSQVKQMKDNFIEAKRRLGTSGNKTEIAFVNGICYGKSRKNIKTPKGGPDYYFYCGQEFWEFISGDDNLYIEIVEPLGHRAKEKNEEYDIEYNALLNRMTAQFLKDFCAEDGKIDWEKLVKYNSGKSAPKVPAAKKKKVGKLEKLKKN